jgi:hypothetical protein
MDPDTSERWDQEQLWFRDAIDRFFSFRSDDEGEMVAVVDSTMNIICNGKGIKTRVHNVVSRTLFCIDNHHYQLNTNKEDG